MEFETRVRGIPCICRVTNYYPYIPPYIYGGAPGDALPPEEEYIEYELLDSRGRRACWLDKYIDRETNLRLTQEYCSRNTLRLYEREYDHIECP